MQVTGSFPGKPVFSKEPRLQATIIGDAEIKMPARSEPPVNEAEGLVWRNEMLQNHPGKDRLEMSFRKRCLLQRSDLDGMPLLTSLMRCLSRGFNPLHVPADVTQSR